MDNANSKNVMDGGKECGGTIPKDKKITMQDKTVYYLALMQSACISGRLKEIYQKEKKNLEDKLADGGITVNGKKDLSPVKSDIKKLEAAYRYFCAPVFTVMAKKFESLQKQTDFLIKQNRELSKELESLKNTVTELGMKTSAILPDSGALGLLQDDYSVDAAAHDFSQNSIIEMGIYPYERDGSMRSIEWIVLEKYEDNTALLISKYGLDSKPYHTEYADVSWESSSLCGWLNNSFYNIAFSAWEQSLILDSGINTKKEMLPDNPSGQQKTDKLFLLSLEEAEHYFKDDNARRAKPTPYAVQRGAYVNGNAGWWWLRSKGPNPYYALAVNLEGAVPPLGIRINSETESVRVAMKVNLEMMK